MTTKEMLKTIGSFAAICLAVGVLGGGLAACSRSADIASHNISERADNFEIPRRVVLYNGITDAYIQEVKGFCSLGNNDGAGEVSVTCKADNGEFVKHIWKLGDNVTVFSEQLQGVTVNTNFYSVTFKPTAILPAITLRQ